MERFRCSIKTAAIACATVLLGPVLGLAATSPATMETKILEWMKTERLISQETTEWEAEREIIADMLTLMKTEKESLQEKIDSAAELSSAAEDERAEILAEKEALEAAGDAYERIIAEAEGEARALLKKLPAPLLKEIQPLVARLPEDSSATKLSLSQRTQNVVGILSMVDKFNSGVTYLSEIRELDNGQNVEVHTLYFGLAAAYFVDTQGATAGYGVPDDGGWEWKADTALAPKIQHLLSIYEQTSQAEFISLPVVIR